MIASHKKIICVDFDGVIHAFSKGWHDGSIYDKPVPGTRDALEKLINGGFEVVIYTIRDDNKAIEAWLKKWQLPKLRITQKKIMALAYIDDRGIRFQGNWEDVIKYFV